MIIRAVLTLDAITDLFLPLPPVSHSNPIEAEIIHLMVEYLQEFLEKPHPIFGGLPICPFSRKARLADRILYKVVHFGFPTDLNPDSPVYTVINEFCQEERYEVLLVIHPNNQEMTEFEMQQFISCLNAKISAMGLVAFGGHPQEDFNIQGVYTRYAPYPHFTVQNRLLLKAASDLLLKTDYYQNWTPENLKSVGLPRGEDCF